MKKIAYIISFLGLLTSANAQLYIQPGTAFYIQEKAGVYLQGNLTAASNIEGPGTLVLSGSSAPLINMNGYYVGNLIIQTSGSAQLDGDLAIGSKIHLSSATFRCNDHNLILGEKAVITSEDKNYFETNGSGVIRKLLNADLNGFIVPLGGNQHFTPLALKISGQYHHAYIDVTSHPEPSINKPGGIKNYLNHHWRIAQAGIKGNVIATGFLNNYGDIHGRADQLRPYYWDGFRWTPQNSTNLSADKIVATLTAQDGELYAMETPFAANSFRITLLNNPVRNFAILEIKNPVPEKYHMALRDLAGRILFMKDISASNGVSTVYVPLAGLASQTYLLDIQSGNVKEVIRIIKIN